MSKFRTLLVTSLLVTLPFMSAQADDHELMTNEYVELGVMVDPTDSDNFDDDGIRMNFYFEGDINLPKGLSMEVAARIEDTLNTLPDNELTEEEFWEHFERLNIKGEIQAISASWKVGKLNAEFGNSIAASNQAYVRDNPLNQVSQQTESVQGIQFALGDGVIPNKKNSDVIRVLNAALSGVTITAYDPNSGDKLDFNSFENLDGVVVSKEGTIKVLGDLDYKVSALRTDDEQRQSIEVSKSWDIAGRDVRTYAQHIHQGKVSDYDIDNSQTLIGAETVLRAKYVKGIKVSAEYTMDDANGDTIALHAQKEVYRKNDFGIAAAGTLGYNTELEDTYALMRGVLYFD